MVEQFVIWDLFFVCSKFITITRALQAYTKINALLNRFNCYLPDHTDVRKVEMELSWQRWRPMCLGVGTGKDNKPDRPPQGNS
jgi:hypothetical protein